MITESSAALTGQVLECDLCVVGAGAAGITIAREFIGLPARVVVLESGGFELDPRDQNLYDGENVGVPYYRLDAARLRFFGGTTNHWAGVCGPLQPLDFAPRDWIVDSGWPIAYEEYQKYLSRARTVCELDDAADSVEQLEDLTGDAELDLEWESFVTTIKQYSRPTRFGKRYRSELHASDNVQVVLKSNVVEIVTTEAGDGVESVRVRNLASGEFSVRARAFVIAAGGLENPRLLLLSDRVHKNGLGNGNDLVGRYFGEHPHLSIGRLVLARKDLEPGAFFGADWRRMPGVRASLLMALTPEAQRAERLPNALVTPLFEFEDEAAEHTWRHEIGLRLKWRELIGERAFLKFYADKPPIKEVIVEVDLEQEPNASSRVRLGDDRDALGQRRLVLDWRFTPLDERAPARIAELLAREVGAQGIGRMQIAIELGGLTHEPGGYHHLGTTRMSTSPARGVVDIDCRVHGIRNLFVAGSSVFPTGGAINPTLSITTLALRLSDHLKRVLRT